MPIPQDILELENRSIGRNGESTLGAAYLRLKQLWLDGNRDREVLLHLMFLSWYGMVEPPVFTGFPLGTDEKLKEFTTDDRTITDLQAVFDRVHALVEPNIVNDAEMLYVVGLMAYLFPWVLGDEKEWLSRSEKYRKLYRALVPGGIDPSVFDGRGAYGEYFAHQAKGKNGF